VRLTARLARWRAQQQARAAQGRLAQQLVRERCEAELPSLLDLVCLGLQAGLSFDAALELYCAKRKTALAERLAQALYAWRMGLCTRQEALRRLAQQLEAPSFAGFVDAVEEALLFGTPLAHTLERQADLLREEERLKTEERIEKIPVKMLIPLGCLVVPGMLLAILGPLLSNAFAVM
jgi:tight adherence protein C